MIALAWEAVGLPFATSDGPAHAEIARLAQEYREWRSKTVRARFGPPVLEGAWGLDRMARVYTLVPAINDVNSWRTPAQLATFLSGCDNPDARAMARHRHRATMETEWEQSDTDALVRRTAIDAAQLAARAEQFRYDPRCVPGVAIECGGPAGKHIRVIGGRLGETDTDGTIDYPEQALAGVMVLRCADLRPLLGAMLGAI